MDPRKFMVIDTSRLGSPRMFITREVTGLDIADGMWHISFITSATTYTYRHERILFFTGAERIDLSRHGFYVRNKHIENVSELYRFSNGKYCYYHAVFGNGKGTDFEGKDVYVSRTTLDECGGDNWKYLRHLAAETGLVLENIGNILAMQYNIVDRKRDNVPLAQYVGDKNKLKTFSFPKRIIFPFGCNESQKMAVEQALTNQVSIIQGPPGTGKTQTILNIIANLMMDGKSVLIVSNNNSAVENVAEKLSDKQVNLGFLVAQLGSKDRKEAFVENQPVSPEMSGWLLPDKGGIADAIKQKLDIVAMGFGKQTILAKRKLEMEALKTESRYNEMQARERAMKDSWLNGKDSHLLLAFKCNYESMLEKGRRPDALFLMKWMLRLGWRTWSLLRLQYNEVIELVESAYYASRMSEIENDIQSCESYLQSIDINENVKSLRTLSLLMLKHKIASKRKGKPRRIFSLKDIKPRTEEFLKEYPVVLSTTYAAKNCISKDLVFDYVIMDEASQVDITTGALALSCAMNAVIVGDDKQLPNVIDEKSRMVLSIIEDAYKVDDKYRSTTHSFLQSCCEVFKDAPQTLLREHYRCHPRIIEFCNQKFYDGQLIIMTNDNDEDDTLRIVRTVEGQHARGHFNQREIDVIAHEVMPDLDDHNSVGIITPYRDQANEINSQLATDAASTVHKYQGRECDHVIMSMVDNQISEFTDNANLMNVAISRAKSRLTIVVTGNEIKADSNIAQLISYVNYKNFQVSRSKIHSVFDLLYKQYTEQRLSFEAKNKGMGELSENLMHQTLLEAINRMELSNTEVICHYPRYRLITDWSVLTDEERLFAGNRLSHVDFLLYNALTKSSLLVVEVDGWQYHQTDVQIKRDGIKDGILNKVELPLLRVSTVQSITAEKLMSLLRKKITCQEHN